jgi:hypothetical protein
MLNFASIIFGCIWMLGFGPELGLGFGPELGLGFGIGGPNAKSIVWIFILAWNWLQDPVSNALSH